MASSEAAPGGGGGAPKTGPGAPPLLLYDGRCPVCNGTVQFLLRRDPDGELRFAPLEGETAGEIVARHPELEEVDSIVFVEDPGGADERASVRSEAALRIVRYLGGAWRALEVLRVLPRFLRDGAYDLFARYRYRLFGRYVRRPVPPGDAEERFLP